MSRYELEKNESNATPRPNGTVSLETRIQILLEEYRALYSLLTFRLTAMDRRLPAIGGTLAAVLGSTTAMPDQTRLAFLLGLPIALLWLFFSTVQHARSKEDHLRRIDEIERLVNHFVGEELLVFQSCHPAKARYPGGRTGFNSVFGVLLSCQAMLCACSYVAQTTHSLGLRNQLDAYFGTLLTFALLMLVEIVRLARYRPERLYSPPSAVFACCRASP